MILRAAADETSNVGTTWKCAKVASNYEVCYRESYEEGGGYYGGCDVLSLVHTSIIHALSRGSSVLTS